MCRRTSVRPSPSTCTRPAQSSCCSGCTRRSTLCTTPAPLGASPMTLAGVCCSEPSCSPAHRWSFHICSLDTRTSPQHIVPQPGGMLCGSKHVSTNGSAGACWGSSERTPAFWQCLRLGGDPLAGWGQPLIAVHRLCRILRPLPVPLTTAAISDQGAYLMDCGRVFVMWLGRALSPDFMTQVCSPCAGVAGRQHPYLQCANTLKCRSWGGSLGCPSRC